MGRAARAIEAWQELDAGIKLAWVLGALFVVILVVFILARRKRRFTIDVGNAQFLGVAETQNDYFACWENENGLLALVSDGIGQNKFGRQCAEIVVKTYMDAFKKAGPIIDPMLFLRRLLRTANQRVTKLVPGIDCGATLAAVLIRNGELYWISVGNSSVMAAGKEQITRMNETYTELYFNEPAYKRKPLAYFDRYIGLEDDLKAQSGRLRLQRKQHVLLCTDGVYLQISEQDLLRALKKPLGAFEKAQAILLQIENKHRTDQDNATLVLLDIH